MSNDDIWYPIVEDLHNFCKMSGGSLEYLADVIYNYLTEIYRKQLDLVKNEKYLGTAIGSDLDKVSSLVDIFRFSQESDEIFRTRIISFIQSLDRNTTQVIKDVFYSLSGHYPEIEEAWTTEVYGKDDVVQPHILLGQFKCRLPYKITHAKEIVRVIDDGSGYGLTVQALQYPLRSDSFDPPNGAWLRSLEETLIGYTTQLEKYNANVYSSHDNNTGVVTLQALGGGPDGKFPKGTKFELQYDFDANTNWNLQDFEYYERVLDEYTTAGVKSSLDIYHDTDTWIYGDEENPEIIDVLIGIDQIWLEPFTLPTTTTQRGSGHWGIGFWGTPDTKWGGAGFPNATMMFDEE